MALLVSTVRTAFEREKHDISDISTATFCAWCDWINKFVYRYIVGIDSERYITTQNYTVTTNPQTSALPATFRSIKEAGTGIFLIDSSGLDTDTQLRQTGHGNTEQGYYLNVGNIIFTACDGSIWKMRFIPTISTLDELTDYFTIDALTTGKEIIGDEYINFAIKALDVAYGNWDEDIGMEGIADQRLVRLLDEFGFNIKRTPAVYLLE